MKIVLCSLGMKYVTIFLLGCHNMWQIHLLAMFSSEVCCNCGIWHGTLQEWRWSGKRILLYALFFDPQVLVFLKGRGSGFFISSVSHLITCWYVWICDNAAINCMQAYILVIAWPFLWIVHSTGHQNWAKQHQSNIMCSVAYHEYLFYQHTHIESGTTL